MAPLVAILVLSAAEPTAVLVSRRTAVSASEAQALAASCSSHLAAAGVPIALSPEAAQKQLTRVAVKDSSSCNGRKACLAELGRQLKLQHLVLMSAATLDGETSLGLELLRVADETVLATDSLFLTKKGVVDAELLAGFAAKVKSVLVPAEVAAPVDAPKEPVLTPTPKPEEPPLLPPPLPPRSHTPALVLGGVGVAALVAGGALLAVGMVGRAPLTAGEVGADGRVRSTLTGAEARALNDGTTPLLVGALGAGVVGLGLGTAALLTW